MMVVRRMLFRRLLPRSGGLRVAIALPTARLITGGSTARQLPANIAAHYVNRLDGLLDAIDLVMGQTRGTDPLPPVSRST
jgi:hypothetical protein